MQIDDMYLGALGTWLPPSVEPPEGSASDPGLLSGALVAGEDIAPPQMAVRAVEELLRRGGLDASDIDILFHVSVFHQGPDGWLPQSYIQRETLGTSIPSVGIQQGCNGLFAALELAAGWLRAAPGRDTALLTTAENFDSPLVDRWSAHPGSWLGDSACALTLTTRHGFARLRSLDTVTVPELEQLHRGEEPLFPPGAPAGRPLDFGTRAGQFRALNSVPDAPVLLNKARDGLLAQVLQESGTDLADVARVISLNTSRSHVQQRIMDPLGLPMSRSAWEFGSSFGHLGAGDQFVTLERMVTGGRVAPGDRVLMLGVGPGVSIGAAVVEILEVPDWS
ncbi:ketoacyl-ACP synthase III family protein [Streptomyces sp. NBC_00385]|uniref:ketoacyl-ACP synthase III family protein n=1 Tax=Streptomyces sp. NBC_00385 TaxID=2975733 RepID=UPI002DD902CB|nr:ketoacyl-ACP synthase III family protein [Streptomyces sp. NBC_00385]WRZ04105.1 ketoacyl-ACP synthase III family protein [Streptomyces sp. NBC_00385]